MLAFFALFLVAISLSMDTFSLSIIYGTLNLSKKKILFLSSLVGIFHFFMPFLGNLIGSIIIENIPINSSIIVGIIFSIIAIQMLFQRNQVYDSTKVISFFLFAFTVSIDSFSVGIGISAITNNFIFAYLIFSITSFLFTYIGLRFGKKLNEKFGHLSTIIGSIILIALGIYYIVK